MGVDAYTGLPYDMCGCLYTGVPLMLVLVYGCTIGEGACIQVCHGHCFLFKLYHRCWCLYTHVPWVWVLIQYVPWIWVFINMSTMGVGACIHVYHGCGCLYTYVSWVWVLVQVYHGCWCLFTCVSWVWVLVYRCTIDFGAYIQVYHGYGHL